MRNTMRTNPLFLRFTNQIRSRNPPLGSESWICASCIRNSKGRRSFSSSKRGSDKPFYVTTPIFYVNADPHIGHLHTMILADVLKRWQQLREKTALMLTGTDEHGMKIQRAAAKAGSDPKTFVDKGAEMFKTLSARANVKQDYFIRTTDPAHKEAVEYAWFILREKGYIYESKHEGWYSVSDETFYPQSAVHLILDPPTGRKIMTSIETGKEVEWTSEINYHFRLSSFREKLLKFYGENSNWVLPRSRMKDIIESVSSGLEDLSISRPSDRLKWGIPVPGDESQTIYVWLDALLNYTTAAGYPWAPGKENAGGWPADIQIIGKDILRFHTIYWPAFLMALDLPLPQRVITHGHWTLGNQKMSKSVGNVVNPFFAMDRFGVDTIRYFMMRWGSFNYDSKYENSLVVKTYKKDLQGGLGNLMSRVLRSNRWDVQEIVSQENEDFRFGKFVDPDNEKQREIISGLASECAEHMEAGQVHKTLRSIIEVVYGTNAWIAKVKPWDVAKKLEDNKNSASPDLQEDVDLTKKLNETILVAAETLRIVCILLQPFIPDKAATLFTHLGVHEDKRTFEWAQYGIDTNYGVGQIQLLEKKKGKSDSYVFPPLLCET